MIQQERITKRELDQQIQVGRALIMLLVAIAIFACGMWLACQHADARPWWMDSL